jgi:nucleotide-binding universal stress UspA family protein
MTRTISIVFAVLPAAAAVESAVAAFQALPLADKARLIGVHVSPIAIAYGIGAEMAITAFIEAQMAAAEEERTTTRAVFEQACAKAGFAYDWRAENSIDGIVSASAGSMCRAADLILCPSVAQEASIGRHQVEDVVFASGRPVIALPLNRSPKTLGKRVIIAWDGGREAGRAVFDALPLLAASEAVRIVSVHGLLDEPIRQFTPGDEIAHTLSMHGVKAETLVTRAVAGGVRETLETQALDFGADLCVMGCYGHSRLRERILGGVSRSMLREIPFPLFLSN